MRGAGLRGHDYKLNAFKRELRLNGEKYTVTISPKD